MQEIDLGQIDFEQVSLKVDIGAASYWSEILNVQTLDNMMQLGIIPDAVTYLESIPEGYIKNKADLIKSIEDKQVRQQQMQMRQVQAQAAEMPM